MAQLRGFPCELFLLVACDVERAYAAGRPVEAAAAAALQARLEDVRRAGRGGVLRTAFAGSASGALTP